MQGYASDVTVTAYPSSIGPAPIRDKKAKVSKAMKAYLERAQQHDAFMKAQSIEYQIGKRHLANMMGEDPDTFTQQDVNVSSPWITYIQRRFLRSFLVT